MRAGTSVSVVGVTDAFYQPLGDNRYDATPLTRGPWDPKFQHGGPPIALLSGAIERCQPRAGVLVSRLVAEFLSPVPVSEVEIGARILKDGRTAQLLEAELSSSGRVVVRARAWRLARLEPDRLKSTGDRVPPARSEETVPSPIGLDFGYAHALEWRVASGDAAGPGPATVWTRLRACVVDGEEPTGLQRIAAAADSGSGVSAVLDWSRWSFVNVDLALHLLRPLRGHWVCLDSRTQVDRGGTAVASTTLFDDGGRIGAGQQSLLVTTR
jgi:acyl-coenzyme A thioesterase PaaI-like protein